MDKEKARFILNGFRPDGADVNDADFAEALKLAMEDRELGAWLASERAFDAAFAEALGSFPLPENLREDILTSLAIERGDYPQADAEDAAWIDALAMLQPPAGFRDRILTAMEATAPTAAAALIETNVVPFWKRLAFPLAAAAGIGFSFFLTRPAETQTTPPVAQAGADRVSAGIVQASFVKTYEAPDFSLEVTQQDYEKLANHLGACGLPRPEDLPEGLRGMNGVGCRELIIDGKRGSLICFNGGEDGIIHLVIFNRDDVMETGPFDKPVITKKGNWTSARWQDDHRAFMLMGNVSPEKLASMF